MRCALYIYSFVCLTSLFNVPYIICKQNMYLIFDTIQFQVKFFNYIEVRELINLRGEKIAI